MKITTTLQHDLVAVQSDTELHLLLELSAPTQKQRADRRPLRLALALDRSGSMGGAKLEAAKRAAQFLVDNLHDDDRLALVTYDDAVDLVAPMAPLDRRRLTSLIGHIRPGGMTNLSGGLLKALEEAGRDTGANDAIRRVVLLSDGLANVGITDHGQLGQLTDTFSALGISTTTVGFGDGFDEDLMTSIADAGRGGAHFAAGPEDLPGIFAQEFDDLLDLVAQNVSVELHPSGEVDVVEVLNSYPAVAVPGGVQVQVGDAFAGQTLRVVVKLRIPALPAIGLANVGDVVLRWVAVDGDALSQHTVTQQLTVNAVSSDDAASATPNKAVIDEVTVLLAARHAAEARDRANRGDFRGGAHLASQVAASLRAMDRDHPAAAELLEQAAALEAAAERMDDGTYGAMEAKQLHYRSRQMGRRKRD